jgi:predicted amidohydrolase YtcJ
MIIRTTTCVAVALLAAACSRAPEATKSADIADLVILDAAIDTVNPAQPKATALAVRGGKITYIGDSEHAQSWVGKDTRVIKLDGATVWPGLIDSHIHLMEGALSMDACSCGDVVLTIAQVAPKIRECIERNPGNGWVVVQDVNAAGFHADRKALDAIVPNRPLLLWAADGHSVRVNSAGLKLAGIGRKTPDPSGGRIERDKAGEPTGFLIDSALDMASNLLEKPTEPKRQELLLRALHDVAADGITTFMEANTSAPTVNTYVSLAQTKQLAARVTFALGSEGVSTDEEFARLKALRKVAESQPDLRADLIKLFADGIMEFPTQSAAMLEPYLDAKGKPTKNLGPSYFPAGALSQFVERADQEGFGVHIHAIGDRAVRDALDAFAYARTHGSKRSYSIAHLELVDPQDIPRFKELNVIASFQLQWAQPDNYSVDAVLPYIGPERQARLYPAHSVAAGGATIAGGSDWNVSTFNPFEAMAVAMSRTNPKEPQRGTLGKGEEMTLREMLLAYTINAARMLGRESEVGSLEPGKAADFIVLDHKLDDSSTFDQVRATKVVYTFIGGAMRIGPGGK